LAEEIILTLVFKKAAIFCWKLENLPK
jgi:hypothetical protein